MSTVTRRIDIPVDIHVCVKQDKDGYYAFYPAYIGYQPTVFLPAFSGLLAEGATEDEAIRNFVAAAPAYALPVLQGKRRPLYRRMMDDECRMFGLKRVPKAEWFEGRSDRSGD